jgi:hypothetical protein
MGNRRNKVRRADILKEAKTETEKGRMKQMNKTRHVRFEVFTAVTMKNAVFWDIKTQFVLHRKHITSLLQSPAG